MGKDLEINDLPAVPSDQMMTATDSQGLSMARRDSTYMVILQIVKAYPWHVEIVHTW